MVEPAVPAEELYPGAVWKAPGPRVEHPTAADSGKPIKERTGRIRACVRIGEPIERVETNEAINETPVKCA